MVGWVPEAGGQWEVLENLLPTNERDSALSKIKRD
jgi:hypothetical protein